MKLRGVGTRRCRFLASATFMMSRYMTIECQMAEWWLLARQVLALRVQKMMLFEFQE